MNLIHKDQIKQERWKDLSVDKVVGQIFSQGAKHTFSLTAKKEDYEFTVLTSLKIDETVDEIFFGQTKSVFLVSADKDTETLSFLLDLAKQAHNDFADYFYHRTRGTGLRLFRIPEPLLDNQQKSLRQLL